MKIMSIIDIQNNVSQLIQEGYEKYPGGYLFVQLPIDEWNTLRSYVRSIGPVRQYCAEHLQRVHFVYCAEAMVAGASWKVGEVNV